MLEKLIETIVLLIAALNDNTAARRAEGNVVKIDGTGVVETTDTGAPPKPPRRSAKDKTDAAPPTPPKPPTKPDFSGGAAPKKPDMSLEDANAVLSTEWERLGGDDAAGQKIYGVLAEFGVAGLTQLPDSSKYREIVEKVQALK
jgi:hypothetical protein